MSPTSTDEKIQVHERLARMEAILESIGKALEDQKECDEKLEKKIDKILENDKDKLKQITENKTSVKNLKAALYVFVVPLLYAVVKSFI